MNELLTGLMMLVLYFIIMASMAFILRKLIQIPDELYRKLLHCILLGSLLIWTYAFNTWYLSVLSAIGFAVILYPVLIVAGRIKTISQFLIERKSGEFKRSLLVAFFMYGLITTVCWGWLGDKLLGLCSIYAWGFGDAAAALVGKRFGKHGIQGKHIEGRKSLEGTLAMFSVSFVCVLLLLHYRGGLEWFAYLTIATMTASVSAIVELYSLDGMDTITCPVAAMVILLTMVNWMGGGI